MTHWLEACCVNLNHYPNDNWEQCCKRSEPHNPSCLIKGFSDFIMENYSRIMRGPFCGLVRDEGGGSHLLGFKEIKSLMWL